MMWQIVCRVGEEDCFEPSRAELRDSVYVGIDRPGDQCAIGSNVKAVIRDANLQPSASALDLLHLAMTVFSADKMVRRKHAYNRWERGLRVFLPVSDLSQWERVKPELQEMLDFLTTDHWEFEFRPAETDISLEPRQKALPKVSEKASAVALLSGGLDSFAGVVELLQGGLVPIALVSHHGRGNVTHKVQNRVYSLLAELYRGRFKPFRFFVQPRISTTGKSEPSSRSRSMLFLSLGTIVASSLRNDAPLYIAENGLMSLNVPLAHDRIGSLSTRTTHPYFLKMFQELLRKLGIAVNVENPYRFRTKGEILSSLGNSEVVQRGVPLTMSCSNSVKQRFQGISPYKHCGYCLPCLIRRAAVFTAGLNDASYNVDILQNPQGEDLGAVNVAIRRMEFSEGPLVFEVLKAGPLPDSHREYVDVYRRGMLELKRFVRQRL